jgi:hypothetical protein
MKHNLIKEYFHISVFSFIFCIYIIIELVLFIARPSFSYSISSSEKFFLFLSVVFLPFLFSLALLPFYFVLSCISHRISYYLSLILSVFILSSFILLLVDTTIYDATGFSLSDVRGLWRVVPTFLFIIVFIYALSFVHRMMHDISRWPTLKAVGGVFLVILFVFASSSFFIRNAIYQVPNFEPKNSNVKSEMFNFLILVSDGINAKNTSVYGYDRDTTPFLRKNKDRFTVIERAYANSVASSSSISSLLSGKSPLTTGLIYYPDILKDHHAYEHLPALLRSLSYYSGNISVRTQTDTLDLGFKRGFTVSNDRSWSQSNILNSLYLNPIDHSFILQMFDRIVPRLLHVAMLRNSKDHFKALTESELYQATDDMKKEMIFSHIKRAQDESKPFFVYAHLMGTHGPTFYPTRQVYSQGKDPEVFNDPDFYDDAILNFDERAEEIYNFLKDKDLLDSTIFIITSDHRFNGEYTNVPLLISLPPQLSIKKTEISVQLLDIAPTIIDALGLEKPEWMKGTSLLRDLTRIIHQTSLREW